MSKKRAGNVTVGKVETRVLKVTLPVDLVVDLQLVVAASGKTMSDFLAAELREVVARRAKAVSKRMGEIAR